MNLSTRISRLEERARALDTADTVKRKIAALLEARREARRKRSSDYHPPEPPQLCETPVNFPTTDRPQNLQ